MILLSIILPLYNGEKYIVNTIRSLEDQNKDIHEQMEIIVVDDGSNDKGYELVLPLVEEYNNIVVFQKTNGGIASAREFGLTMSKGRYITFCDQDDSVLSGYSSFIKQMDEEQADIMMSDPFYSRQGVIQKANKINIDRLYEHVDCLDM